VPRPIPIFGATSKCITDTGSGSVVETIAPGNREVKFGALMDQFASEDTWIATGRTIDSLSWSSSDCFFVGHYARKSWSSSEPSIAQTARPMLLRPADRNKDQTYYLSHIPESSLARTLFPLAPYTKPQVRDMAREWALPTAERGESMGICFVGQKRRFSDFLCAHDS
jgi:tRNA-5-taurinomethyluridine 2-sulfurtransferase